MPGIRDTAAPSEVVGRRLSLTVFAPDDWHRSNLGYALAGPLLGRDRWDRPFWEITIQTPALLEFARQNAPPESAWKRLALTVRVPGEVPCFLDKVAACGDRVLVELWAVPETPPAGRWRRAPPLQLTALAFGAATVHFHKCGPYEDRSLWTFQGPDFPDLQAHYRGEGVAPWIPDKRAGARVEHSDAPSWEIQVAKSLRAGKPKTRDDIMGDMREYARFSEPPQALVEAAFDTLQRRGWITTDGGSFRLTDRGRRALNDLEGPLPLYDHDAALWNWLTDHDPDSGAVPPPWPAERWSATSITIRP